MLTNMQLEMLSNASVVLYVNKCNLMLDYFEANELKLNFSKCEYLIVNGKEEDLKTPLDLNYGALKYKSVVKYLGMKISDSGI